MINQEEKPSKYKAKKATLFNIVFDSKAEARYYLELLSKYNKEDIKLQPQFVLQDAFIHDNKKYKAIKYIADFQVGNTVIDVKGFKTKDFCIKEKLFRAKFPHLELKIIEKSKLLSI